VLPVGVTNKYSSLNCYTGTVSGTLMAKMDKLGCRMRNRFNVDKKKEHDWMVKMGM
jgi:hypothetical protein